MLFLYRGSTYCHYNRLLLLSAYAIYLYSLAKCRKYFFTQQYLTKQSFIIDIIQGWARKLVPPFVKNLAPLTIPYTITSKNNYLLHNYVMCMPTSHLYASLNQALRTTMFDLITSINNLIVSVQDVIKRTKKMII